MGKFMPKDVDHAELVFGGCMDRLMPEKIPSDFISHWRSNKWCDIVEKWFFNGLDDDTEFVPKEGIDSTKALRHVGAILKSWEPKHETKIAACGYLLSLWFDEINLKKGE